MNKSNQRPSSNRNTDGRGAVTPRPIEIEESDLKSPACAIDIGGSLAKIVFFEPDDVRESEEEFEKKAMDYMYKSSTYGSTGQRDDNLRCHINALQGTLHFIHFQSSQMENAMKLVTANGLANPKVRIQATGGGAVKYAKLFEEVLGTPCPKGDELECLIRGIAYMLENHKNECYTILEPKKNPTKVERQIESPYPFLLVNFGSGVSFLRVDSPNFCERVGGSCLGGATFTGLVSTLTGANTFEECVNLASRGNQQKVDMLVQDIYGGDYEMFNLKGTVVASSFGKMIRPEKRKDAKPEDIAAAVMAMITNNVGSIAYLHSLRYEIKRIVFSGNFFTNNKIAMNSLAYSLLYWSGSKIKPLFLEHEGFFGAIGALLLRFASTTNSMKIKGEEDRLGDSESDNAFEGSVSERPTKEITEYAWEDKYEMVIITFSNTEFKNIKEDDIKCEFDVRKVNMCIYSPTVTYTLSLHPLHGSIVANSSSYLKSNNTIIIRLKKDMISRWTYLVASQKKLNRPRSTSWSL